MLNAMADAKPLALLAHFGNTLKQQQD